MVRSLLSLLADRRLHHSDLNINEHVLLTEGGWNICGLFAQEARFFSLLVAEQGMAIKLTG